MPSRAGRFALQRSCKGFTYIWILGAIAVLSVGLLAMSEVWTTVVHRQKLGELDWNGAQIVRAIGSYYETSPGFAKSYPETMEDLIEDRRSLVTRRHLRAIYSNPFSDKSEWELVIEADGRFRGVRATFFGNSGALVVKQFIYRPTAIQIR